MNSSTKAMLLSGLLFPGLGQMMLKCYLRGLGFMLATLGAMAFLVTQAVQAAYGLLDNINTDSVSDDLEQITIAANRAVADLTPVFNWVILGIILVWILSVVDAFMLGRKIERESDHGNVVSDLE